MSRIGATLHGFEQILLKQLQRSNFAAAESAFRLSTGKNFNSPKDDPSAFLQVSLLEKQISHVTAVRGNVERAATIGANAQITLESARTQLDAIRAALVTDEDNTLTLSQKLEKQATIDASIDTIRSLSRTSIEGKRLFDGSYDYSSAGKNTSQVSNVDVLSLDADTSISGTVTTAATQTVRRYTGAAGLVTASATFNLTGSRGSSSISVSIAESLTVARDRINLDSHLTGITASVSGNNLDFTTVGYGTDETISISVTSGTFNNSSVATGADAVVTINGNSVSSADIDGNRVNYREAGVNLVLDLTPGYSGAITAFTVSDDSVARYELTTQAGAQTKVGFTNLFPETLGGLSGYLDDLETGGTLAGLGTASSRAIRVVDEALERLTLIEAKVNAFADVAVESASQLLAAFETNLSDALEDLNLVDEEAESLRQSKYENLSSNAISAIAVWQQQQSNFVGLLQLLAGMS